MSLFVKGKRLKGIRCYRPIIRDPSISDAEFRTLMLLKAKAMNGQVEVNQKTIASERGLRRETVNRHIMALEKRRVLRIVPHISRGVKDINTYILDDEFYAKHLAKKPAKPCDKKRTTVSYDTIIVPGDSFAETPPNVIPLPVQKPKRRAKS